MVVLCWGTRDPMRGSILGVRSGVRSRRRASAVGLSPANEPYAHATVGAAPTTPLSAAPQAVPKRQATPRGSEATRSACGQRPANPPRIDLSSPRTCLERPPQSSLQPSMTGENSLTRRHHSRKRGIRLRWLRAGTRFRLRPVGPARSTRGNRAPELGARPTRHGDAMRWPGSIRSTTTRRNLLKTNEVRSVRSSIDEDPSGPIREPRPVLPRTRGHRSGRTPEPGSALRRGVRRPPPIRARRLQPRRSTHPRQARS